MLFKNVYLLERRLYMEQIRYGGTSFELVPNGLDDFTNGKLILRHRTGDKNLEEIKAIAKNVKTIDSIDLLDADGKLMQSLDGYVYAGSIQEIDDYLVEVRQTEQGQEEVRADVAVVTFRLPDVREELKEVKAIQDEILVVMLEGGI